MQRHQQDVQGLEEGSWREEWVAEETAINLPLRAEDQKKTYLPDGMKTFPEAVCMRNLGVSDESLST